MCEVSVSLEGSALDLVHYASLHINRLRKLRLRGKFISIGQVVVYLSLETEG